MPLIITKSWQMIKNEKIETKSGGIKMAEKSKQPNSKNKMKNDLCKLAFVIVFIKALSQIIYIWLNIHI